MLFVYLLYDMNWDLCHYFEAINNLTREALEEHNQLGGEMVHNDDGWVERLECEVNVKLLGETVQ